MEDKKKGWRYAAPRMAVILIVWLIAMAAMNGGDCSMPFINW